MMHISVILGMPSVPPLPCADEAGCQRVNLPPAFPVYRVRKHCPECGNEYTGHAFQWQRDSDPAVEYACDACQYTKERMDRDRKAREQAEWDSKVGRKMLPTPRKQLAPVRTPSR